MLAAMPAKKKTSKKRSRGARRDGEATVSARSPNAGTKTRQVTKATPNRMSVTKTLVVGKNRGRNAAARARGARPSKAAPAGGLLATIPRDGLWLMKSEPDVYSIADLERDGTSGWESVRNFMARNFMKDEMRIGDLVLFYHSNAEPSGIAGVAKVAGPPRPDPTQFDPKSEYVDRTSPRDAPRWVMVDVAFVERFERVVSLDELKSAGELGGMLVTRKGMRLSVQPVIRAHFEAVLAMAGARTRLD